MPLAKETVLGSCVLSSTTQTALAAAAGQSLTVRNFSTGNAYLQEVVGSATAHPFTMQIKSPKMHDTTYGIQFSSSPFDAAAAAIFNPQTVLPSYVTQKLYATDVLTWSAAGTNADTAAGLLDIYYTDLSGIAARLYSWQTIEPLIVNLAGVTVTPETSGTANGLGTSALLNSGGYNLKANTDYAILGWNVQNPLTAVLFRGTDTGNLWVGGPGSPVASQTGAYFVDQAVKYQQSQRPAQIPVFNSNNAGGFEVNIAGIGTSASVIVSLTVAQLSQLLPSPGAGA
jgi:hypothetical protein